MEDWIVDRILLWLYGEDLCVYMKTLGSLVDAIDWIEFKATGVQAQHQARHQMKTTSQL